MRDEDLKGPPTPSPWTPERDPARLKVLGKLAEECGELCAAVCAAGPSGWLPGALRRHLEDEIADVGANCNHAIAFFGLVNPGGSVERVADQQLLGRLGQATGQLVAMVSRCIIQGIGECEPVTGKPNRAALEACVWDALQWCAQVVVAHALDEARIVERSQRKLLYISAWRAMLEGGD